ncbi:DUF4259 domain-containing protein [Streptomyces cyaneofuscatus]
MDTWDIGPFDNETAANFAGDLNKAAAEERIHDPGGARTRRQPC